jgi:polysaccharide export outer membrane protein
MSKHKTMFSNKWIPVVAVRLAVIELFFLVGLSQWPGKFALAQVKETPALLPSAANARTTPQNSESSLRSYVIGPGDILQVDVWKEPEASMPSVVVRSDGVISLPLIKEISVAGMTPRELEQLITQKLARLIRDADVTVLVKEIHSEKIYVVGAVKKEGPITLQGPLTVVQAIAECGGFTDYAKRSKIYILRLQHGKQLRFSFDYSAVIRGQRPEQNIVLAPGDSIVVPQ